MEDLATADRLCHGCHQRRLFPHLRIFDPRCRVCRRDLDAAPTRPHAYLTWPEVREAAP